MPLFETFLRLGFDHIADLSGYDHILFLVALTATVTWRQWQHLLFLVTAFTLGHSITLALATVKWVIISSEWVEFLIPLTIVLTALVNIYRIVNTRHDSESRSSPWVMIALVTCFGLIHGLGFSTFLRHLLGQEESIVLPLLYFNLGLEVGQVMIVAVTLSALYVVTRFISTEEKSVLLVLYGGILALSFEMAVLRIP